MIAFVVKKLDDPMPSTGKMQQVNFETLNFTVAVLKYLIPCGSSKIFSYLEFGLS